MILSCRESIHINISAAISNSGAGDCNIHKRNGILLPVTVVELLVRAMGELVLSLVDINVVGQEVALPVIGDVRSVAELATAKILCCRSVRILSLENRNVLIMQHKDVNVH